MNGGQAGRASALFKGVRGGDYKALVLRGRGLLYLRRNLKGSYLKAKEQKKTPTQGKRSMKRQFIFSLGK